MNIGLFCCVASDRCNLFWKRRDVLVSERQLSALEVFIFQNRSANCCLIKATAKSQMTQSGKKGKDQNNTGKYFPDMLPNLHAMLKNSLIPPNIFKKDTRKICLVKILPGFYKVQVFL